MNFGCLEAKIDIRDYKIKSSNVQVEFPDSFQLDNLPSVKNQKDTSSCVAHATSSILEYYDKSRNQLSTQFIYGIQKKLFDQYDKGMYLVDACKIVKDYGDMLNEDCPGNDEIPVCYGKAEQAFSNEINMQKAYAFRTASYYLCENPDDIKYALMNYGPVLAAVNWHERYHLDKNNKVIFNNLSPFGGHAIFIYGWNEDGWLCQNSWGTDFGDNGRMIIDPKYIREARAIIDYDNLDDEALISHSYCSAIKPIIKFINLVLNIFRR